MRKNLTLKGSGLAEVKWHFRVIYRTFFRDFSLQSSKILLPAEVNVPLELPGAISDDELGVSIIPYAEVLFNSESRFLLLSDLEPQSPEGLVSVLEANSRVFFAGCIEAREGMVTFELEGTKISIPFLIRTSLEEALQTVYVEANGRFDLSVEATISRALLLNGEALTGVQKERRRGRVKGLGVNSLSLRWKPFKSPVAASPASEGAVFLGYILRLKISGKIEDKSIERELIIPLIIT